VLLSYFAATSLIYHCLSFPRVFLKEEEESKEEAKEQEEVAIAGPSN
jgi:hypothetical protein